MKGSYSQAQAASRRRRCAWLLPLLVGAAFLGEIAFLGRIDLSKNAAAVESWTTSFYRRSANSGEDALPGGGDGDDDEIRQCVERLEREDAVPYDRDFETDPVLVGGAAKACPFPPALHFVLTLRGSTDLLPNWVNIYFLTTLSWGLG
jgi:glycoprotein 3-alpha-L-fucosyltransferase